ncbi:MULTISPECIES: HvfC family RiPP maturation protein [Gammaproteobacteria]|uniref:HvfC family RiPP maturation protein n=1 Tax=Gammaproteobacteria TaxID=1236 RepID=UPI001914B483|nr:putative DNA-binding domain-containing protein [Bacillus sp. TH86]MBK5309602.1 putative DNA-binding domain-containing protein [Pseudomonas sp. TH71]MBK5315069.1 putative DNA-binding domain-containing protein [Erwinia sp. TH79]MBK5320570.1 putative DNA-binding domain-containing protein [Bacillus sp. TH59]MBK5335520.1 putative DNA-binding domain-containing protein [Bacillus sp. TH57]MBK5368806.1 putative DNA-binding domain-containing protein [Pseudomonas sp. TH40]MBK5379975.1 putative DNA-bi
MDKSTLYQQQNTLTRYLRDPDHNAPPAGMDVARSQVYRDLVFSNLSSLLSGTFPVLVKILGDDEWRSLVRIFLRDYRAQTPKFGEIAQEFVEFLASEPLALSDGTWPPFMVELAHYEWVEMALQQSDAEPLPASDATLLLDRPLQVSPLAWPLAYGWPVQLVGPDYRPDTPVVQPTLLLVRRSEDWSVRFSELSPFAWRLLQRIGEFPQLDGRAQLEGLAVEAGMVGSLEFIDSGLALLRQMHGEGVIGIFA